MFIVFEGIDGGGKTTLSNRVAAGLRAAGLRVAHVREGGTFASTVTQALRELGRDARHLALTPRAEMLLYLTRDVQLADEAIRPALARNDVVIADRYVYTAEVLAIHGRGLPASSVTPLVTSLAGSLVPDLVVLVDVDPAVARARRSVAKLLADESRPPSRKGLTGTALQKQLRRGYRELAAREPGRWITVDNTEAELDALTNGLVERIRGGELRLPPAPPPILAAEPEAAAGALLAWVDRRARLEPGLAAYLLAGLHGPGFDERRVQLATRAPRVVADGLRAMTDPVSWQLRRALVTSAPHGVARSLVDEAALDPDADAVLAALVTAAPRGVASALHGRDDDAAWRLREALSGEARLASLAGLGSARAQAARAAAFATLGGVAALDGRLAAAACVAVSGVPGDEGWAVRERLEAVVPAAALGSTRGLDDERAWAWRERAVERAPKLVMASIAGLAQPRAWALREAVAARCEEVLDTIVGFDDGRAWALRREALERWPASVLKSLGPLAVTEAGRELVREALRRHPADVSVWRQALRRAQMPSSSPSALPSR